jgi:hypothetical protein
MNALSTVMGPLTVATKEDIAKMSKRLQAIEEQLARVIAMLERLSPEAEVGSSSPGKKVARTKRFAAADSKNS